jgi:hypothetical protein
MKHRVDVAGGWQDVDRGAARMAERGPEITDGSLISY